VVEFRSILFCPLGGKENPAAVRRLVDLADSCDASITLLGVGREPPRTFNPFKDRGPLERIAEADRSEVKQQLTRWAASCEARGVEVIVRSGNTALTIVTEVLTGGHDLVVVTTDDDREDRATIKRMLRKCPCPVWVIRPTRARTQRVMVAVNPEHDEADLNRSLLELGAALVDLAGGELHVAHAWELFAEDLMRSPVFGGCSDDEMDELRRRERSARHQELLALVGSSLPAAIDWDLHLVNGPPAPTIVELVRRHRINLLVMGTVARTGIAGVLMGNTAEHILDEVSCSVITAKPPGFVSPLARDSTEP
jgi:nucleotide-binding universal stress UspA family protein